MDQALLYVFLSAIAISVAFNLHSFIKAIASDIREIKRQKQIKRHPSTRQLRVRPLVSIVIYTRNNQQHIQSCLKSIIEGSYRKYEIIVVDNASKDETAAIAKDFANSNKSKNIRIVAKKIADRREEAISYAVNRWANGEIILVIDGSCSLDKKFLVNTVANMSEPDCQVLLANIHLHHDHKLFGIASQFQNALSLWQKKTETPVSFLGNPYNYATAYRKKMLATIIKTSPNSLNNTNDLILSAKQPNIRFGSSVVAKAWLPKNSRQKNSGPLSSKLQNFCSFIEIILGLYMGYIAVVLENPGYFLFAWGTFTAILLLKLWSDESRSSGSKLALTLMSPLAYALSALNSIRRLVTIPLAR